MSENQSLWQESQGRSQVFTFPRRELLQKTASAAALLFAPRTQSLNLIPEKYPKSPFNIGDLVAEDWLEEDEDDEETTTDFGEIVGMCYLPQKSSIFPSNTWVYFIYWTHSTSGASSSYPCYDGEPTGGDRLRLVSHD